MEKATVAYLPEVVDYLDELGYELYIKEYFGFIDSAKEYIYNLRIYVESNIQGKQLKIAPPYFRRFATHYITYRTNKRTTWYIFFLRKGNRYLVTYITNNHVKGQHIRTLI